MIKLGIDEFTAVILVPKSEVEYTTWHDYARATVIEIEEALSCREVFGKSTWTTQGLPQGYTNGLSYPVDAYFSIAYHNRLREMGITVKFSAHSLSLYKQKAGEYHGQSVNELDILNALSTLGHEVRLSRIDVFADYINEGVNVNTIYQQLKRGNQVIRFSSGRENPSILQGLENNGKVSTLYKGSRGKNNKCYLRVYDKRKEQIDKSGWRYQEAMQYNDWVRFECVYKGQYSHDITRKLLSFNDTSQVGSLIVKCILNKYSFYSAQTNQPTAFTKQLIDLLNSEEFEFSTPTSRDISLERSYDYLITSSGLITFLYKVQELFGSDAVSITLDNVRNALADYEDTSDVRHWLKRHRNDYLGRESELVFLLEKGGENHA